VAGLVNAGVRETCTSADKLSRVVHLVQSEGALAFTWGSNNTKPSSWTLLLPARSTSSAGRRLRQSQRGPDASSQIGRDAADAEAAAQVAVPRTSRGAPSCAGLELIRRRSSSSTADGATRGTQVMSQLLVRAPDRLAAPGKAEVSDIGGEEHPPGPFDIDAQLAAEGRYLRGSSSSWRSARPRGTPCGPRRRKQMLVLVARSSHCHLHARVFENPSQRLVRDAELRVGVRHEKPRSARRAVEIAFVLQFDSERLWPEP